jgi:hypothetical protein
MKKSEQHFENFEITSNFDFENIHLTCKTINNEEAIEEQGESFTKGKKKNISYECIICESEPKEPLECESCHNFICNECYLKKLQLKEIFNCSCKNNSIEYSKEMKSFYLDYFCQLVSYITNIINETKSLLFIIFSNLNQDITYNNNIINENNYENILKINVSNDSIKMIDDYIKEYLNVTLQIFNDTFNKYNEEQANYFCIEKLYNNKEIKKGEIKDEIKKIFNDNYKDFYEEYFLKKSAYFLFLNIIDEFKAEIMNEIYNLELKNPIQQYLQLLREIEKKSYEDTKQKNKITFK